MDYTIGMVIQGIGVLVNSVFILFNYSRYKKYRPIKGGYWVYVALITFNVLCLVWCVSWFIYDAGKISGNW